MDEGMPPHWEKAMRRNGQLAVDVILAIQKWKIEPANVPDARDEPVVPIVEEAEQKQDIKQEMKMEDEGSDGSKTAVPEYQDSNGHEQTEGEDTAVEE